MKPLNPPPLAGLARLPVVLIGGYLGAGKTTLVNHLLRHAQGLRVAVLVNDFGSVNIDAELLTAQAQGSQAGVISLAGGCLCCSFGDDLVGTLQSLQQRQPAMDVVLIELSGVALPAPVARTVGLARGVELVGSLVVADALQIRQQAADTYVGETVCQQLQQANGLLLNKAGLLQPSLNERDGAQALLDTEAWLATLAPRAPCLTFEATELPAQWVWDWCQAPRSRWGAGSEDAPAVPALPAVPAVETVQTVEAVQSVHTDNLESSVSAFADRPIQRRAERGPTGFVALSLPLLAGVDLDPLGALLVQADLSVLRAKALLQQADGTCQLLQMTPGRWQVTAVATSVVDQLVVIGLKHHLDEDRLRQTLQPWLAPAAV